MRPSRALVAAFAACAFALTAGDVPADIAPQGAVGALAVSPQGGRVLVGIDGARPGAWLFSSDDRGLTWRKAGGMAGTAGVTALAFAPGRPSVAYAAVITRRSGKLGSGFYASSDGGTTWHATAWKPTVGIFHRQLPAAVDVIVVDPRQPRTVYAVTHGILRRSLNGGASWAVARNGLPPTLDITSSRSGQLAAGRGGTLYYATGRPSGAGQVYRSVDRGASWQPAGAGLPPVVPGWSGLALASDATRGGVIYAATGRGLYATANSGRSWSRALNVPATAVATAKLSGRPVVVIASAGGLVERVGAAGAWTRPGRLAGLALFTLDPVNAARIYRAAYTQNDPTLSACASLWISADFGATWKSIGAGLPLVRKNCS
ncbi:MAG TPA: hypothetical protein VFD90_10025 [Gaiellales bacterium]|jgi:hypothetical protein|nr:hypothetical protein [Gaiellales bacterium]